MSNQKIPIWLDCDPGVDDAFAILLLLFHPKFNLLGISTVHGNAPLETTTHNALGLLELLKINHIPVYPGESKPLAKEPFFAAYAHGESGMDGADLPETPKLKASTDKTYLEAMRDAILAHPGEICVVASGTFTNMALLIEKFPDVKEKIKYVPIMGCGFGVGNVTKYAEFNVFVDPKAANIILGDEILMNKIIVNGLNITNTAVADSKVRQKLFVDKPSKNVVRMTYENILNFYYNQLYAGQGYDGAPLHDPLAVFTLLPVLEGEQGYGFEWFRKRARAVEGGEKDGQTFFVDGSNFEDEKNESSGSIIAKTIDMELFYDNVGIALDNAENHVETATD